MRPPAGLLLLTAFLLAAAPAGALPPPAREGLPPSLLEVGGLFCPPRGGQLLLPGVPVFLPSVFFGLCPLASPFDAVRTIVLGIFSGFLQACSSSPVLGYPPLPIIRRLSQLFLLFVV